MGQRIDNGTLHVILQSTSCLHDFLEVFACHDGVMAADLSLFFKMALNWSLIKDVIIFRLAQRNADVEVLPWDSMIAPETDPTSCDSVQERWPPETDRSSCDSVQ
ncbi:hypothetical protein NE237_014339 [Protea cynaroides]|uniref:Uncharacterized protein n=1 Tax=Protea cynaroides TaxID=273540 RepID=A0A9Q0KBS8_9MAGN|nr:hypothetical protein NE237_014339 [Protea cynaroides]